jgi:hypothetical protein
MPSSPKLLIWLKEKKAFEHFPIGPMLIYFLRWRPAWISNRHKKPIFCRGPSNDHSWVVWFKLSKWFQRGMLSSQKLQIWLKPNCTWMFIGWSSTNSSFFVPIWNSKWLYGGGHLGFPIGIKNLYFVENLPMIILGQIGLNCPGGFREEELWDTFPIGSNVFFVPIWNSKWRLRQDLV